MSSRQAAGKSLPLYCSQRASYELEENFMGRKNLPGLQKRFGVWQIDKKVFGQRICESTGTSSLEEAEKMLARRMEELRQAKIFGVRPKRIFVDAATKFLRENQHKASIVDDVGRLKLLVQYIGNLNLDAIHMGALQSFIEARKIHGVKTRTINHALKVTRRILNLAATEWLDENGLTWLHVAPKIKLLKEMDNREPYPLSWEEQDRLFAELPDHLRHMALFAVNTGCRDAEICNLRWEWEVDLGPTSVFAIPARMVKNRMNRLVVLNNAAKEVIESVRGKDSVYVFTHKGKPIKRMLNTGWKQAREKAGLPGARVHDLKHTFGRRLRAVGVGFEDRQDLLGHKSARITTHYSSAEIGNLIAAANKACDRSLGGVLIRIIDPLVLPGHENLTSGGSKKREELLQLIDSIGGPTRT